MPTGLHIYVDGAMTASATNVPPPALNGQPVTIGRGSFGNFAGSIDSLRIYDRALSAGEIMAISADASAAQRSSTTLTPSPPCRGSPGAQRPT